MLLALVGGQVLACAHSLSKMHMLCLCKLHVAIAEPVFCNASPAKRGRRAFAVEIQVLGRRLSPYGPKIAHRCALRVKTLMTGEQAALVGAPVLAWS
jgi:hypothetical protein